MAFCDAVFSCEVVDLPGKAISIKRSALYQISVVKVTRRTDWYIA